MALWKERGSVVRELVVAGVGALPGTAGILRWAAGAGERERLRGIEGGGISSIVARRRERVPPMAGGGQKADRRLTCRFALLKNFGYLLLLHTPLRALYASQASLLGIFPQGNIGQPDFCKWAPIDPMGTLEPYLGPIRPMLLIPNGAAPLRP